MSFVGSIVGTQGAVSYTHLFTRNLAIGLGVVAVCAIGAAISIATLGAGSILAGAFIGCLLYTS